MSTGSLARCYNKSCCKEFNELENTEDCIHHPGIPVFHDALKGWSCCKKRVTDFTEFLNIAGCTKSKHSSIKPPEPEKNDKLSNVDEVVEIRKPMEKLGMLQPRPSDDLPKTKLKTSATDSLTNALLKYREQLENQNTEVDENESDEVKPGTVCKNSCCKQEYKNESSNDEKCWFHPGVPIFHEGYKFWTCCQKRTSDFNEFLNQEGCTPTTHRWELTDEEKKKKVLCRYDWYQMGNFVVISIFSKLTDPQQTVIEANQTTLSVYLVFGDNNSFELNLKLYKLIDPSRSSVLLTPTKVDIKLRKEDIGAWSSLELKPVNEKE